MRVAGRGTTADKQGGQDRLLLHALRQLFDIPVRPGQTAMAQPEEQSKATRIQSPNSLGAFCQPGKP